MRFFFKSQEATHQQTQDQKAAERKEKKQRRQDEKEAALKLAEQKEADKRRGEINSLLNTDYDHAPKAWKKLEKYRREEENEKEAALKQEIKKMDERNLTPLSEWLGDQLSSAGSLALETTKQKLQEYAEKFLGIRSDWKIALGKIFKNEQRSYNLKDRKWREAWQEIFTDKKTGKYSLINFEDSGEVAPETAKGAIYEKVLAFTENKKVIGKAARTLLSSRREKQRIKFLESRQKAIQEGKGRVEVPKLQCGEFNADRLHAIEGELNKLKETITNTEASETVKTAWLSKIEHALKQVSFAESKLKKELGPKNFEKISAELYGEVDQNLYSYSILDLQNELDRMEERLEKNPANKELLDQEIKRVRAQIRLFQDVKQNHGIEEPTNEMFDLKAKNPIARLAREYLSMFGEMPLIKIWDLEKIVKILKNTCGEKMKLVPVKIEVGSGFNIAHIENPTQGIHITAPEKFSLKAFASFLENVYTELNRALGLEKANFLRVKNTFEFDFTELKHEELEKHLETRFKSHLKEEQLERENPYDLDYTKDFGSFRDVVANESREFFTSYLEARGEVSGFAFLSEGLPGSEAGKEGASSLFENYLRGQNRGIQGINEMRGVALALGLDRKGKRRGFRESFEMLLTLNRFEIIKLAEENGQVLSKEELVTAAEYITWNTCTELFAGTDMTGTAVNRKPALKFNATRAYLKIAKEEPENLTHALSGSYNAADKQEQELMRTTTFRSSRTQSS